MALYPYYAFSSYYIVIIGAGHVTKVLSLAYMPGVIAGILLVYKKKKNPGFADFAMPKSMKHNRRLKFTQLNKIRISF